MSARANYFKLGLFVIAGMVVLIAGVLVLGGPQEAAQLVLAARTAPAPLVRR